MKKLSPEALKISQKYHPTSVKFKDKTLLARLGDVSAEVDRSQRQIIEYAVKRILDAYDREGPIALEPHHAVSTINEKESNGKKGRG